MKDWNTVEQYELATPRKKNNCKDTYSKRS